MKKIISVIIAFAMITGMMTGITAVHAAGDEISTADELKTALANGGDYKLADSIDDAIIVSENLEPAKGFTLDLNGKTLDLGSGSLNLKNVGDYKLSNGTIKSTIQGTTNGAISLTASDSELELSDVDVTSGTIALYITAGTVSVENSIFDNTVTTVNGFGVVTANSGTITITDSNIKYKTNNSGSGVAGIRASGNPVFVLNNVSALRNGSGFTQGRAITVAGSGNYVAMTINGGKYEGTNGCIYWQSNTSRSLTISDGVFTTSVSGSTLINNNSGKITITGGTFGADPTAYVDTAKYDITPSDDGKTWTVTEKKEATPTNITVNYADETLEGFAAETSYKIDGEAVTLNNNTFALGNNITDEEHSIAVQTAAKTYADSDPLNITIKARPLAPSAEDVVTVTQPTEADGKGTIAAKVSGVEYSTTSATAGFVALDSAQIDGGKAVYIRMAAMNSGDETDKQFHSLATSVTLKKMSAVTLNTDGGDFAQPSDNITSYYEGEVLQLPTGLTKQGHTFGGWYATSDDTKATVTEIGADATGALSFTAKWTVNQYKITFEENGGDDVEDIESDYNANVNLPTPARTGYTFNGWKEDNEHTYDGGDEYTITDNVTLTAQWTINSYTISVEQATAAKGTVAVTGEDDRTITANEGVWTLDYGTKFKVTVTATGENVLTENSITVGELSAVDGVYTMPANNVTISAEFTDKQYKVKKSDGIENGDITINGLTDGKAKAGETITVTATPTDDTYKLTSLTVNYTDTELRNIDITTAKSFTVPSGITGDITITPVFERIAVHHIEITPKTISIKKNTSGDFTAAIYADDDTDLTAVYKDSLGWTIEIANGGAKESGTAITPDGSDNSKATLSVDAAQSKDNTITVKATIGDKNGTATVTVTDEDVYEVNIPDALQPYISVDKVSAVENAEVTITVVEKNGYKVKEGTLKVTKSGNEEVDVTNNKFTMPAETVTISADLEKITYTLTNNYTEAYINTNNGKIEADKATYNVGDKVVLTVTPKDGYKVTSVSYLEAGEDKTAQTIAKTTEGADEGKYVIASMPAANVTVSAVFDKESYALTNSKSDTNTETNGGGYLTLSPMAGNVLYDTEVTVTVNPNTGYELATLSVGGENVTSSVSEGTYTFNMPAAATEVTATFRAKSFLLTKVSSTGGSYTISGITFDGGGLTASVTYGTELTISPTPSEGYEVDTVTVTKTGEENTKPTLNNNSFTMPDYPVTVSVTFSKVDYTISTSSEYGTIAVTGNKATANKDDEITFTVNPDEGYELKKNSVKVNDGSVDVSESDGTYSFTMPAGNVTITAEFDEVIPVVETVTVTFNVGDGELTGEASKTITKGSKLTEIPTASKTGYTFTAWSDGTNSYTTEELLNLTISTSTDFTAEYTINKYTITWLDEDDSKLGESTVEHGTVPSYPNATPTKADTDEYTYTFNKWTPDIVAATESTSYKASYTAVSKDAPKSYLPLLNTFEGILQIEKAAGEENSVVLTAEALDDNILPTLNLYLAIYEDNTLKSVSLIPFAADANGDVKAGITKPALESGETFKIMLWTGGYEPVIGVISSEDFFN